MSCDLAIALFYNYHQILVPPHFRFWPSQRGSGEEGQGRAGGGAREGWEWGRGGGLGAMRVDY